MFVINNTKGRVYFQDAAFPSSCAAKHSITMGIVQDIDSILGLVTVTSFYRLTASILSLSLLMIRVDIDSGN
jgi:hypothetical protein